MGVIYPLEPGDDGWDVSGQGPRRPSRRTLLMYLAAWLAVGAAIALVAVVALDDGSDAEGTLPPVRHTALESAARAAGCRLERRRSDDDDTRAAPATGGSYRKAPSAGALGAAQRRGTVVLSYRPDLPEDMLKKLRIIQKTVPRGTILAPGARTMPYEVAISAYRRLLSCPRLSTEGLDAVRLFQGRYLGSGPGR
jgi:hypothetical protein